MCFHLLINLIGSNLSWHEEHVLQLGHNLAFFQANLFNFVCHFVTKIQSSASLGHHHQISHIEFDTSLVVFSLQVRNARLDQLYVLITSHLTHLFQCQILLRLLILARLLYLLKSTAILVNSTVCFI